MPRSCSAARQCHRGGWRRFHRHAAPPGDAPWRCRLVPFSRTVPEYGRVLTRPSTSAAPDQRCAMCPRRPSCPRLTARRATPPTPPPSRPGWGRARAWRTFRCGRWSGPFAGPPPPSTATGLVGDHLVAIRTGHRAAFTQAARATASRARRLGRLVRRRPGHHYPRPVASPGLALAAATALVVLAPANHFLLDAAGGLAVADLGILATSRPSQLLTRRPTGGSTVAR